MSSENRTSVPNSLNEHWMPFTSNKDFKQNPRLITEAKGVYLKTHHGKTQIDASSGLFCNPLGHGRKEITEAVTKQLDTLDYDPDAFEFFSDLKKQSSVVVTPENFSLKITENNGNYMCQPLRNGNYEDGIKWEDVLKYYGNLDDGISRLRLKYHGELDNLSADVIGTLSSTTNPDTP